MPVNLIAFSWVAVVFTTLSAFHGFELAFGATTIGGDVICLVGAVLVVAMAQASGFIFHETAPTGLILKAICVISLLVGSCYACMGSYSFFSPDTNPGEYLEHHFWKALATALSTGKGDMIAFVTLACVFFSTQPLKLPARTIKEDNGGSGGSGFQFHRGKEPSSDKPIQH
jgi:hypothetical protein